MVASDTLRDVERDRLSNRSRTAEDLSTSVEMTIGVIVETGREVLLAGWPFDWLRDRGRFLDYARNDSKHSTKYRY